MQTFIKISFVLLIILNNSVNLLAQLDTVCIGDRGNGYGVNTTSSHTTFAQWVVEGESTNEVNVRYIGDTVIVDWVRASPGFYTLAVTEFNFVNDSLSCQGNTVIDSVFVWGVDSLDIGPDSEICYGETMNYASNMTAFSNYSWSNGANSSTIDVSVQGDVWLEGRDIYGCVYRDSAYLVVHSLPFIDLGEDMSVCDEVWSGDVSSAGVSYNWYADGNLIGSYPIQEISDEFLFTTGYDSISVIAQDIYGCYGGDTVVLAPCFLQLGALPNLITPNGDDHNDVWIINRVNRFPHYYNDLYVEIFNRWGKLVWRSTKGYTEPWGGIDFGGKPVPVDSYFYVIYLKNGGKPVTGHISVIR